MAKPGDEFEGRGQSLRIDILEPDLLVMESSYDGTGSMPPAHFHPNQAERFEVLEGSLRAIVDGDERVYAAGESFDVPAGITHQMTGEGPATMRWEVRPSLRTAEFFERLYSGNVDENFLDEFKDEVRFG